MSRVDSGGFFNEQGEQSAVKTAIVTKYFDAWSTIMLSRARGQNGRIAYIDLFSGPGIYDDDTESTPIVVLKKAIHDSRLRDRLVTIFNDKNPQYVNSLRSAIDNLAEIDLLKYRPQISNIDVGSEIARSLARVRLVPTLLFVDPWGYKGLTLELVGSVLSNWGCDVIFFFNYNRINMGLNNPYVAEHMRALFGASHAESLRDATNGMPPYQREMVILNELSVALQEIGGTYTLPFSFRNRAGVRTSHHLIFVSKNALGYHIVKDIMARESASDEDGVATFEYNAVANPQLSFLYALSRPLESLREDLLRSFTSQTISMQDIYEKHNVGTRYVKRNYKDALLRLEHEGEVVASPAKRRANTFGDTVMVAFPTRKEP